MGMERPTYAHPALRPALRETFGVIVYHEQVMRTLAAMAGYSLTEADFIRRHLGRDDMLPGFHADFLERAGARGVPAEVAERTWNAVAEFASFGFCKAHAAAFAVPTYQSSWLKTHYPAHFLAGILTHDPGMYPRRLLLQDAREHDIPILPLDVNVSELEYVVEEVGPGRYGIRLALQDVHQISDAEVRSILQARAERPFRDVGDFLRRAVVSRPVVQALAHAGAFDRIDRGTRRDRLYAAMTTTPQREGDQLTLDLAGEGDRGSVDRSEASSHELTAGRPELTSLPEYTDAERVRAELEVLGLDASRHLVSFYEPLLADLGVTRSRDLRRCRSDERVMVAGVKVASQTPAIRSGQRIIFLTLDDATGPIDVTVFESVQPKVAKTVFHSFVLAVLGTVRRTGVGGVSVVAEDVWDLLALHRARRQGRLTDALAHEGPASGAVIPRKLWHSSPGSSGR
jgi:error-prone DNA polymerase